MTALGWTSIARLLRLDARVDFFAVNGNILRLVNTNPNLRSAHAEYGDIDLISDGNGFADATGEYQHVIPPTFQKYSTNARKWGLPANCNPLCTVCVFGSQTVPCTLASQHGRPRPRAAICQNHAWRIDSGLADVGIPR